MERCHTFSCIKNWDRHHWLVFFYFGFELKGVMGAHTLMNFCGGFLGVCKGIDAYFCFMPQCKVKKWGRGLVRDTMESTWQWRLCVTEQLSLSSQYRKAFHSLYSSKCYRIDTFSPLSGCWQVALVHGSYLFPLAGRGRVRGAAPARQGERCSCCTAPQGWRGAAW